MLQTKGCSLVPDTAFDKVECCIWNETAPRVLYMPYTVLTGVYVTGSEKTDYSAQKQYRLKALLRS